MILLVDAGNTRIKWRVIETGPGAGPVAEGVVAHEEIGSLHGVFRAHPRLRRLVGCNVAGPEVAGRIAELAAAAGLAPEWLTPTARCGGVRNLYDDPAQLGADRWAALIGARRVHAQILAHSAILKHLPRFGAALRALLAGKPDEASARRALELV